MLLIKRLIVCFLSLFLMLTISGVALAEEDNGDWNVQTDLNGDSFVMNPQTGEKIVEVFRFDEMGTRVDIDLDDYVLGMNQNDTLRAELDSFDASLCGVQSNSILDEHQASARSLSKIYTYL